MSRPSSGHNEAHNFACDGCLDRTTLSVTVSIASVFCAGSHLVDHTAQRTDVWRGTIVIPCNIFLNRRKGLISNVQLFLHIVKAVFATDNKLVAFVGARNDQSISETNLMDLVLDL